MELLVPGAVGRAACSLRPLCVRVSQRRSLRLFAFAFAFLGVALMLLVCADGGGLGFCCGVGALL